MDIRPWIWPRSPNNTTSSLYSSVREYRAVWKYTNPLRGRYACVECDIAAESCRVISGCIVVCFYYICLAVTKAEVKRVRSTQPNDEAKVKVVDDISSLGE